MPGNRCVFLNCSNVSGKNKDVAFHKFPMNEMLKQRWLENCEPKALVMKGPRICSAHFEADDYEKDLVFELMGVKKKKLLKPSAVPKKKGMSESMQKLPEIPKENRIPDIQSEICSNDSCKSLQYENEFLKRKQTGLLAKNNRLKTHNLTLRNECGRLKGELRASQNLIKKQKKLLYKKMVYHSDEKLIKEIYPKFKGVFSTEQLDLLLKRKKKVKWTNEDISKAVRLKMLSLTAYNFMREKLHYPLPCIRTLQLWASKFDIHAGFSNCIFDVMEIIGDGLSEREKIGVLVLGEMEIKSVYEYDREIDQVIARPSQMQVLLFRGLFSNWKQPLYIGFNEKITIEILNMTCEKLENSGFTVVAWVSDCESSNVRLPSDLNVDLTNSSFLNPKTGTPIFVFSDASHMLELVRNQLLETGFQLQNGSKIDKQPLIELLDSTLYSEGGTTFELTVQHLIISDSKRQNVKLAAEVLSRDTATALRNYESGNAKEAMDLADFIEVVNDWFDLMNSKANFGLLSNTGYGLELEEQNEVLDKMVNLMHTMRCGTKNSFEIFQKGIILSINSLKRLFLYLQEKYIFVEHIDTRRLNQNALERFFDQLRERGGAHDLTPIQALGYIKSIVLGKNPGILHINGDQLIDSEEEDYLTAYLLKNLSSSDIDKKLDTSTATFSSASESTDETIEYIAGWIANKFHEKYPELLCSTESNFIEHNYSSPTWMPQLSEASPIETTFEWKEKIFCMNRYFERNFPVNSDIGKVENIKQSLLIGIINEIDCPEELITCFIDLRIDIRVKYMNMQVEENKEVNRIHKRNSSPDGKTTSKICKIKT